MAEQITPENISQLLSRLDQAMQTTRCVGATIPEDDKEGFDRRAAVRCGNIDRGNLYKPGGAAGLAGSKAGPPRDAAPRSQGGLFMW
jgi:hypothetical protein